MDDDITYVRGPRGETVVVVPSNQKTFDAEIRRNQMCYVCSLFWMIFGGSILLSGFIVWCSSVYISRNLSEGFLAAYIMLGIGLMLMVLTTPMWCYMYLGHKQRIERYMYKEGAPPVSPEEVPPPSAPPATPYDDPVNIHQSVMPHGAPLELYQTNISERWSPSILSQREPVEASPYPPSNDPLRSPGGICYNNSPIESERSQSPSSVTTYLSRYE